MPAHIASHAGPGTYDPGPQSGCVQVSTPRAPQPRQCRQRGIEMATNNLAGIPGYDASLPGGWTGTDHLTNRWGDVQANPNGSLTLTSTGEDAGALSNDGGSGYGLYSFDLDSHPGDAPGMYAL